jgi:hypothetical protein
MTLLPAAIYTLEIMLFVVTFFIGPETFHTSLPLDCHLHDGGLTHGIAMPMPPTMEGAQIAIDTVGASSRPAS